MKTYLVQLEDHDDVISARDKIAWSKARRVLLVWPRSGKILERRVDLLLLMRFCQQTGAQMAVVTRSREVKYHARDLGIPVFDQPEQAYQSAWRRPVRKKRKWRSKKPIPAQDLRQQRGQFARMGGRGENRWLRAGAFTLAVLSFLLLVLSFIPGARVTLTPVRDVQQLSLDVWADPEIQTPNPSGGLPARALPVVVEGRLLAASTGRTLVPDRFAAGSIRLTNLTSGPVVVPQGTVVLAGAGQPVRYFTTREVRLPPGPGSSAEAPIRAVLPGRSGNVGADQIRAVEGALGLQVTVSNPEAVTGGSDRSSPAPTQEDFRRLRESLISSLRGTAVEELKARLKPGLRLLEPTLKIRTVEAEEREPAEGQPSEQLQLTMRIEFEAQYIEESDLEALASPILDASLPKGFRPVPGSFQAQFAGEPLPESGGDSPESARWKIVVQRQIESTWEGPSVIRAIQGKPAGEARQILQSRLALAEMPKIELYPAWWGRLPFLPARIALVQQ